MYGGYGFIIIIIIIVIIIINNNNNIIIIGIFHVSFFGLYALAGLPRQLCYSYSAIVIEIKPPV
jgi:hypothetical protein